MSTFEASLPPAGSEELIPVQKWLTDLCGRLDGWSRAVRGISADEWVRLRQAVSGAVGTNRLERVVREFLTRVRGSGHEEEIDRLLDEFRGRILTYRSGLTIDHYENHVVTPPSIRL